MAGLIGGALAGLGQGIAQSGLMMQQAEIDKEKQAAEALKQDNLARLQAQLAQETHVKNAQADVAGMPARAAAEASAEETTRPARMQTEREKADITAAAHAKATPQQLLDYYEAHAHQANAMAAQINRGAKDKQEKIQLPSVHVEKDADGNLYNVDQNSGAIGVLQPGEAAQSGKSHWFSPDEAGKAATQPKMVWQYNGKVLPNGLADLYPDLSGRMPQDAAPAETAKPTTGARPPLSSFMPKSAQVAPQQPAQATANPDERYIEHGASRIGQPFKINAPQRSPVAALNGKTFASKQEALDAISALYQ